jgi:hypothetical protein
VLVIGIVAYVFIFILGRLDVPATLYVLGKISFALSHPPLAPQS